VPGTGGTDTGDGFGGARDLDHNSANVKNTVKAYLQWLKNEIGYDGWRYDMVKGFKSSVIGEYNGAANADLSVGEYWDGNYSSVMGWVNGTSTDAAKKSMAFDFPAKYSALNQGLQINNYGAMAYNGHPAGLIRSTTSSRYAVTFVDNHDTYRDNNKYTGDVLKAYAFIMSSPGIPCVFYAHWSDPAHPNYKTTINNMIKARKTVGLHSESDVEVQNTSGYYKAYSVGTCGAMLTYIGANNSDWASNAPTGDGWSLAYSGTGWAIYTKIDNTACGSAHQNGIDSGVNPPAAPTFNTITLTAIVPAAWTTPKIHVWNPNLTTGAQITTAAWPGDAMTHVEGNKYSITLSGFTAASEVGIVINNGTASNTKQTFDLFASGDACWVLGNTQLGDKYFAATPSAECTPSAVEMVETADFSIFPNPVDDILNIKYTKQVGAVSIYNVAGQKVMTSKESQIDVTALQQGIYILRIDFENHKTAFGKFQKM
jgi:alpha-amylase